MAAGQLVVGLVLILSGPWTKGGYLACQLAAALSGGLASSATPDKDKYCPATAECYKKFSDETDGASKCYKLLCSPKSEEETKDDPDFIGMHKEAINNGVECWPDHAEDCPGGIGLIIGIVVGVLVLIGIGIGIVIFMRKRAKKVSDSHGGYAEGNIRG